MEGDTYLDTQVVGCRAVEERDFLTRKVVLGESTTEVAPESRANR